MFTNAYFTFLGILMQINSGFSKDNLLLYIHDAAWLTSAIPVKKHLDILIQSKSKNQGAIVLLDSIKSMNVGLEEKRKRLEKTWYMEELGGNSWKFKIREQKPKGNENWTENVRESRKLERISELESKIDKKEVKFGESDRNHLKNERTSYEYDGRKKGLERNTNEKLTEKVDPEMKGLELKWKNNERGLIRDENKLEVNDPNLKENDQKWEKHERKFQQVELKSNDDDKKLLQHDVKSKQNESKDSNAKKGTLHSFKKSLGRIKSGRKQLTETDINQQKHRRTNHLSRENTEEESFLRNQQFRPEDVSNRVIENKGIDKEKFSITEGSYSSDKAHYFIEPTPRSRHRFERIKDLGYDQETLRRISNHYSIQIERRLRDLGRFEPFRYEDSISSWLERVIRKEEEISPIHEKSNVLTTITKQKIETSKQLWTKEIFEKALSKTERAFYEFSVKELCENALRSYFGCTSARAVLWPIRDTHIVAHRCDLTFLSGEVLRFWLERRGRSKECPNNHYFLLEYGPFGRGFPLDFVCLSEDDTLRILAW